MFTPLDEDVTLPTDIRTDHEAYQSKNSPLKQPPCDTERKCDHTNHGSPHIHQLALGSGNALDITLSGCQTDMAR